MIRLDLIVVVILILGALFIISNENLSLANGKHSRTFVHLYALWLQSIGDNMQHITAQVISSEWFPRSESNATR